MVVVVLCDRIAPLVTLLLLLCCRFGVRGSLPLPIDSLVIIQDTIAHNVYGSSIVPRFYDVSVWPSSCVVFGGSPCLPFYAC